MRNRRLDITTMSLIVAALLGAVVTFLLFVILLIPLVLLIKIFGG
jgi:hypothetical protein